MKKRYKVLISLLGLIVILSVAFNIFLKKTEASLDGLKDLPIENPDMSAIPDGLYEGRFSVFPVSVVIEVRVSGHEIVDLKLLKHDNGQGGGAEALLPEIIRTQSIELDAVSGATYSSIVILKAVEDALSVE